MLILTLALPPLIAKPEDVSRLSAAMIAIGYLCAFVTPIVGGALWDATGVAARGVRIPWLLFAVAAIASRRDLRFFEVTADTPQARQSDRARMAPRPRRQTRNAYRRRAALCAAAPPSPNPTIPTAPSS